MSSSKCDSKSDSKESEGSLLPRASVSLTGTIIDCTESFAKYCQRPMKAVIGAALTDFAKFENPAVLLEAAYQLDQLADYHNHSIETWKAPLQSDLPEAEDYSIVAHRTTEKLQGKHYLEVYLRPPNYSMASTKRHSSKLDFKDEIFSSSHSSASGPGSPYPTAANAALSAPDVAETSSMKVLVVEDSPTALKLMSRMISRLGHHVSTAMNGIDALELLKKEYFDIVLMDINMPMMNGLEASHEFRKIERQNRASGNPYQKIIAMSGDISNTLFHEVTNAGFDAFIPKPLTEERFHEVLRMPSNNVK